MDDVTFASIEELYRRVKPALITRCDELKRIGMNYVAPEDIWNYLKDNVWNNSRNLRLFRMVDDILNVDNMLIDDYLKQKLSMKERHIYFENENKEDTNEKESN